MKKLLLIPVSILIVLIGIVILSPVYVGTWLTIFGRKLYCRTMQEHVFNYSLLLSGVKPEELRCMICESSPNQKNLDFMAGIVNTINLFSVNPDSVNITEPERQVVVNTQNTIGM